MSCSAIFGIPHGRYMPALVAMGMGKKRLVLLELERKALCATWHKDR